MFCGNCGAENNDGVKFCKECGKPLTSGNVGKNETSGNLEGTKDKAASSVNGTVEKLKTLPKTALIGACAGIVVLVLIIVLGVNSSNTINLNKYVTVEASGYEGYGRAIVTVDWDAIEKKYGSKVKFTSKAKNEYGGLLSLMTPMDALEDSVNISLDKRDKLTNGDVVSYKWNVDDDLSQYIKCKVKYKDDTYKVSGLEEIGSFDAFADLSVSFEGMAPNGMLSYTYNGSDLSTYDFKCEKSNGLRNGDVVKIFIDENDVEYFAEQLGKVPAVLEKEFTVVDLDEYVGSYSDLTDDFLATMKSEAEDTIYAYVANSYSSTSKMANLSYAGYVMNSVIDGSGYVNTYNDLYMIYTGSVSNSNGDFDTTTVYFPVRFTNIIKSKNGLNYSDNYGICGSSSLGGSWWYSTKGYVSPLECYIDIADSYKDSYKSESGDGFEVYSKFEVVDGLADISDTYKASIQGTTKALIETYIEKNYNGGSVASDLAYVGDYLLVSKNSDTNMQNRNRYFVVFSATVSNTNGRFETTTVYFPVEYDGVVKLEGDEYVVFENSGIKGSSYLPDSYYSTSGYVDGADMYSSIVTSNRDSYTYEISDGLQQFGH